MTTRLYLDFTSSDKTIVLPADEGHYLTRVLRLKVGDLVHIYNGRAGEWSAVLSEVTKSSCLATIQHQLREPVVEPMTRLIYAPLKHDAMAFLFEKATELGVTHLQPMVSDFSQNYNVHADKVVRQLKQASQQCERLSVPVLLPVMTFDAVLRGFSRTSASSLSESSMRTPLVSPTSHSVSSLVSHSVSSPDVIRGSNMLNEITGSLATAVALGVAGSSAMTIKESYLVSISTVIRPIQPHDNATSSSAP